MDEISARLAWMAWTWQTGVFFVSLAVILVIMTLLAAYRPETPKVGILQFATTRSDRLFVSLLSAAFIYLIFIRLGGITFTFKSIHVDGITFIYPLIQFGELNFIYPSIASLIWAAILFRFA